MQDFFSRLGHTITRSLLFIIGALFAFSLLVAGLVAALLLGLVTLLGGGRFKAQRFRMPPRPGTGASAGRGEVVDVEVREISDPPPPSIGPR